MTDSSEIKDLGERMRADWDRRVTHDYRFWMSDGHKDDRSMWESGERDFKIISEGVSNTNEKTILELGCGVGRLLKSALSRFKHVYGFDVSERAIAKAKSLLGDEARLSLYAGDGFTLKEVSDASVDLVISFAALVSMPTDVIARYLVEIHRILKPGGLLRVQIYLGKEQVVAKTDTLHLRCYDQGNFESAVKCAGFDVQEIKELVLPFTVSFKEAGLFAMIASMQKSERAPKSADEISKCLLPQGESSETSSDADLEYWMSVRYAEELVDQGNLDKAKETLEYAETIAKTTTVDVKDLLERIVKKIEEAETKSNMTTSVRTPPVFESMLFDENMRVLKAKFPQVALVIQAYGEPSSELSSAETKEGVALLIKGQYLDHPDKPQTAAQVWVKRTLAEQKIKDCNEVVIFGFGAGYHVEELLARTEKSVSIIEPSIGALKAALGLRDLTKILPRLKSLWVGLEKPSGFSSESELILRPQTQVAFPEFATLVKATFYSVRGISSLHPSIGVLGPLQGGTLPITAYTVRALSELKQRTKEYDVSGFASGFHLVEKFIFDKYRVAAVHGTYLEMVSHVVLESINEKPIDILICMAQAPITGRLLTELRKKGVITVLWFVEDYLRFTYWKDVARYFDFVFTIQKGECLNAIKAAGAGEVHYLPVGCDPFIHAPAKLTSEEKARWGSPVSFVGAGYHNRQQMFASLAELPFKIWGSEWPTCRPFDKLLQEEGRRLTPAEYVKIFSATDININLHSSTERDGVEPHGDFVNPRTLELASCGAFQLVDERTHLPELLTPGKEVITFTDVHDLKDKIRYYLNHPEERARIAANARERVIRDHTYVNRYREMLSIIYNSKFEQLKRKQDESPWSKMIVRSEKHEELHSRCNAAYKRGEEPTLDGLVADIVSGKGKLTETEQKLLFLFHVRKQIIRMKVEELGTKAPEAVRRGGV